jgi:hypothetical protein
MNDPPPPSTSRGAAGAGITDTDVGARISRPRRNSDWLKGQRWSNCSLLPLIGQPQLPGTDECRCRRNTPPHATGTQPDRGSHCRADRNPAGRRMLIRQGGNLNMAVEKQRSPSESGFWSLTSLASASPTLGSAGGHPQRPQYRPCSAGAGSSSGPSLQHRHTSVTCSVPGRAARTRYPRRSSGTCKTTGSPLTTGRCSRHREARGPGTEVGSVGVGPTGAQSAVRRTGPRRPHPNPGAFLVISSAPRCRR